MGPFLFLHGMLERQMRQLKACTEGGSSGLRVHSYAVCRRSTCEHRAPGMRVVVLARARILKRCRTRSRCSCGCHG